MLQANRQLSRKLEDFAKRNLRLSQQLDEQTTCKVCYGQAITALLLPCLHLELCRPCALRLEGSVCPFCKVIRLQDWDPLLCFFVRCRSDSTLKIVECHVCRARCVGFS